MNTKTGPIVTDNHSDLDKFVAILTKFHRDYLIHGNECTRVHLKINKSQDDLDKEYHRDINAFNFTVDICDPTMPFIWIEVSYSKINQVLVAHVYDYSGLQRCIRRSGTHDMLTIWFGVDGRIITWNGYSFNFSNADVFKTLFKIDYTSPLASAVAEVLKVKEDPIYRWRIDNDKKTND